MGPPVQDSLVTLGIITDIQYSDKNDKLVETGKLREYSKVLGKTELAVTHLNDCNVTSTIHLGDIIDGRDTEEETRSDLDAVLVRLSALHAPVMHVLGNHCLQAGREYVEDKLNLSEGSYYYVELSEKWRLIVLDTVDISVERREGHPYRKLALDYLKAHAGDMNAKDFNGGVGLEQVNWLQDLLRETAEAGKFALVCGHLPLLAEASHAMHVAWENGMVLDLFRVYNGAVKAYFCGHYHEGGYAVKDGVHHVTFEAILDSRAEEGAAAVVKLHDDRIVIAGMGDVKSRTLTW